MKAFRIAVALIAALPVLVGCHADESLKPAPTPPPVPSGGAIFQRYVAMGNSITAGFQSAGINDSTQKRSYASLLAAAMGTSFTYPSLFGRGCPPPFDTNTTQSRVGGSTSGTDCDLRFNSQLPNNVAIPGAQVEQLLSNFGTDTTHTNALTFLFLGGLNPIQAMEAQNPTFVSLWIGNNDVLGAFTTLPDPLTGVGNPGDVNKITPVATFIQRYDSTLDAIQATGAKAVLISVADVTVIPYASAGVFYYCLKNGGCPPPLPAQLPQLAGITTFKVSLTCSPLGVGLTTLVPWPIGLGLVQTAVTHLLTGDTTSVTLDCTIDQQVITSTEITALKTAVAGYNAHIQSEATARGYAYFDVNPALAAELQSGANPTGRIPPFPDALGALVLPPARPGPILFRSINPFTTLPLLPLFTQDGVHPSALAHQLVADSVASAINQTYGSSLPVPVCGTVTCPAP
jgi:lysophospholipase L1-like esterase